MRLKPFFTYYGGKWRTAPRYPQPECDQIIEPFAGSAGYALCYSDRKVLLVDKDPAICGVWQYLIRTPVQEILALPDVEAGQSVDSFALPQEARWLIGFWLNKGAATPCKTPSAWMRLGTHTASYWGRDVRERIAKQVDHIRHWQVRLGGYEGLDNPTATWFVDPPYQHAGRHYRHGAADIDYRHLGHWCRIRRGQVLVCENEGASWLDFEPFLLAKANPSSTGGKVSKEMLWQQCRAEQIPLPLQGA